ncbi:MAG TPA: RdgB/HAM1 family non-canonical purine NTP pyrophosphatase [Bacteroidota bacterium]|nr:RdgB/HAM1 family non-canonical purine NTP pyrophosphatase [Bacteroidota bacterium]
MDILLATNNRHKVEEITGILAPHGFTVKSLVDFPNVAKTIEDQPTLEGNALKKASEAFAATGVLSFADDTGLECYYLELKPGVISARYAGENATYAENNVKLLNALKGVPPRRRNARFRTVIAIVGKGIQKVVEGKVEGDIAEAPRGSGGFGYDPLFIPAGSRRTYAEMTMEEKNKLSHRAMAVTNAVEVLKELK